MDAADEIKRLRATVPSWRPIDDGAKGGKDKPVIIAVSVRRHDGSQEWVVGEAWWNDRADSRRKHEVGFWWAGTSPGDYHADPVEEMTGTPMLYQPMPAAPEVAP